MIMNTWHEEEVSGNVVGAYYLSGQLFCNGRKQGRTISATSEEELKVKANEYIAEKKAECPNDLIYKMIYPGEWELKIMN